MMPIGTDAHGIGDRAFQAVLGQALEDEVRNAGGGPDREVERGGVGHAGAMRVGDGNVARRRQLLDLLADAVDEHQLDAEAAQDRDVDEQVAEILVGHDRAVEGDDKDLPLEPRHVLEDAAEVRRFDRGDGGAVAHRGGEGVFVETRAASMGDVRRGRLGTRSLQREAPALGGGPPQRVTW